MNRTRAKGLRDVCAGVALLSTASFAIITLRLPTVPPAQVTEYSRIILISGLAAIVFFAGTWLAQIALENMPYLLDEDQLLVLKALSTMELKVGEIILSTQLKRKEIQPIITFLQNRYLVSQGNDPYRITAKGQAALANGYYYFHV